MARETFPKDLQGPNPDKHADPMKTKFKMKTLPIMPFALLGALVALPLAGYAVAYGSLSNFDVVNDTGGRCYGFEIELDDIRSTDITYTYNYNHYGLPTITEDLKDPLHPKTYVRYESKKNPDGTYASFTNPQDPANPLSATDGHAFTNLGVNLGGEHFGVGYRTSPTVVTYHWLVDNSVLPGTLALGPVVNVGSPIFNYVPPAPNPVPGLPPLPAQVQVVVIPPPPEPPEVEPPVPQFGVPVWVKILKTVQPSGHKIELGELLPLDEIADPDGVPPWQGEVEQAETEIEWMVFQKRPAGNPDTEGGEGEIEAADDLPNGDETVTRRYEFYEYLGPTNPEDGEADCSDPADCEGSVGKFIGAQMAGFNLETPLGLIDLLQDGENLVPYVDRTLVVGGAPPYLVNLSSGALPTGLFLDPVEGVLSGTPTDGGQFTFTVEVVDDAAVVVTKVYTLTIVDPLNVSTPSLPQATENAAYSFTVAVTGGTGPYTWAVDSLPQGLNLSADGLISGTPALGTVGNYSPTFSVTDSANQTASVILDLSVEAAPAIRGDVNHDGVVDRMDLALVVAARNTPATGPDDPRDLDHDGRITVRDARIVVTLMQQPKVVKRKKSLRSASVFNK